MNLLTRFAVFSVLGTLSVIAAHEVAGTFSPGSRRHLSSGSLLATAALCLTAVLLVCFRDYHVTNFLHAGLVCLGLGTATAVPAGLLTAIALRRGFAADAGQAGIAGGTLAGLAGVTMLELHCPNFQIAHLLVWHLGVLLVSATLGEFIARYAREKWTR